MNAHERAISKLALAKLIQNDEGGIRYWAKEVAEFPPSDVSAAVDAVINSGVDYVHLGMVKKAVRDYRAFQATKKTNEEQVKQSREDRFTNTERGVKFFSMIKEAMVNDEPVDVRKALLKANEYGRANTVGLDKAWDESDREHREAIGRIGG